MRYLGIDYGSKKIGLALTDESGVMAFPHSVIPNDEKTQSVIESLLEKESIDEIVMGYSLDREGKENPIHLAVEALMTDLTLSIGLPIHLEPEQYTSAAAARTTGKNAQTDAAAAALILESFLSKKNPTNAFDSLNE